MGPNRMCISLHAEVGDWWAVLFTAHILPSLFDWMLCFAHDVRKSEVALTSGDLSEELIGACVRCESGLL